MKRILLIEPDRVLARTYRSLLENKGYSVQVSYSAQEAINLADKTTPDLIIVEVQLISHSGIEFLYELRSYPEWQRIPVIILSIIPRQEFEDNWDLLKSELNVASYLYKPSTDLKDLAVEVSKILK